MGDYFKDTDNNSDDSNGTEQEAIEDNEQDDDIKIRYRSVDQIINARNKLHHEINIKVSEYKERIGRLRLFLFGDPDNPDYSSKIDKLTEEIEHPLTREHPMAYKAKDVIKDVKEIQVELNMLTKYNSKWIKEQGTLLDNSLVLVQATEKKLYLLYQKLDEKNAEIESLRSRVKGIKPEDFDNESYNISQDEVDDFMSTNQKYINTYVKCRESGDEEGAQEAGNIFLSNAKTTFNKYKNSKEFSEKLFSFFIKLRMNQSAKLFLAPENKVPQKTEPSTSNSEGVNHLPDSQKKLSENAGQSESKESNWEDADSEPTEE